MCSFNPRHEDCDSVTLWLCRAVRGGWGTQKGMSASTSAIRAWAPLRWPPIASSWNTPVHFIRRRALAASWIPRWRCCRAPRHPSAPGRRTKPPARCSSSPGSSRSRRSRVGIPARRARTTGRRVTSSRTSKRRCVRCARSSTARAPRSGRPGLAAPDAGLSYRQFLFVAVGSGSRHPPVLTIWPGPGRTSPPVALSSITFGGTRTA